MSGEVATRGPGEHLLKLDTELVGALEADDHVRAIAVCDGDVVGPVVGAHDGRKRFSPEMLDFDTVGARRHEGQARLAKADHDRQEAVLAIREREDHDILAAINDGDVLNLLALERELVPVGILHATREKVLDVARLETVDRAGSVAAGQQDVVTDDSIAHCVLADVGDLQELGLVVEVEIHRVDGAAVVVDPDEEQLARLGVGEVGQAIREEGLHEQLGDLVGEVVALEIITKESDCDVALHDGEHADVVVAVHLEMDEGGLRDGRRHFGDVLSVIDVDDDEQVRVDVVDVATFDRVAVLTEAGDATGVPALILRIVENVLETPADRDDLATPDHDRTADHQPLATLLQSLVHVYPFCCSSLGTLKETYQFSTGTSCSNI